MSVLRLVSGDLNEMDWGWWVGRQTERPLEVDGTRHVPRSSNVVGWVGSRDLDSNSMVACCCPY